MDSMLSVVMVRRSIPEEGPVEPATTVLPPIAVVIVLRLAALEMGAPSMMMEVPWAWPPRIDRVFVPWRSGLKVSLVMSAPGSRAITSIRELACMCSIAVRLILEAVAAPALDTSAVTVTWSRWKSATFILKSIWRLEAPMLTLMETVS